ncbi:sigma-70 family RNA polymerase sigma factor [Amycolatopsis sp. H20-H5]|uniref:sigma-70 family RNA polymerase sigma factor n=1 Tax=Amycolatopsis sp. H20-H5 TaxID=3046309 RepID=UPI002DBAB935|nr:sigma-70 family RNA polymerase sigma factor [Amycolatopsis sp. H20-H5]MEC3976407.1 sigma-70 family RNA polymerase sigma factor [Amycolatopsis sp. H20-H5]
MTTSDVFARTTAPERDRELRQALAAVARHDELAFARFYAQVRRPVYLVTQAVLGDHHWAEDTTDEVLIEVWTTAASRYVPARGEVLPWLMTIAHRRAVDRVRSVQAARDRERSYVRLCAQVLPQQRGAPDAVVEGEQTAAQLRRALSNLTDEQREPLVLAYFDEYTRTRIALELGIPRGTVSSRITAGLRVLREQLAER